MTENLAKATAELIKKVDYTRRHAGLQLDKYSDPGEQETQKASCAEVTRCQGDDKLLQGLHQRRAKCLECLGALTWEGSTAGPLTLHLSRASGLENAGICLHPVYGFAYVPGSGLKGLARAYAETVWAVDDDTKRRLSEDEIRETISRVFGWTSSGSAAAGEVVFHDAWPVKWPKLYVDIVNNHHGRYYGPEFFDNPAFPGDWENPVPVYFLAIKPGARFSFAVSPRSLPSDPALLELARQWLVGGLTWLGAGAKTAAGYGVFAFQETCSDRGSKGPLAIYETQVSLVTPGFLAGAGQNTEDCDLRSATLRGLLRWWWRTLHADALQPAQLRELEAAIWGSTEIAGAVQVFVEQAAPVSRRKWSGLRDPANKYQVEKRFATEHNLSLPPRRRTPGLFYLSYGMDDGDTHRPYVPPGAAWKVRLIAKRGYFAKSRNARNPSERTEETILEPEAVLDQARAALWLLRQFGGVGAKSRKGFGCLDDDPELDLEWCLRKAAELRRLCGLNDRYVNAYGQGRVRTLVLQATDPWWVLNELGLAVQKLASMHKHDKSKEALGLPRKIHGPQEKPLPFQNPATHRSPEWLGKTHPYRLNRAPKDMRHAAPIHYHVGKRPDGTLVLRVVTFPQECLPDLVNSERMLTAAMKHVASHFASHTGGQTGGAIKTGPKTPGENLNPPREVETRGVVTRSDEGEGFIQWFNSQRFSEANRGEHSRIVDRIKKLSTAEAQRSAKRYVKEHFGSKKKTTDSVWDFLIS